MEAPQKRKLTGQDFAVIIIVTVVLAVVGVVVQDLLFGKSSPPVTGGAVGGIVGALVTARARRRSRAGA